MAGGILTKSCQSSDSSLRGADIVRCCSPDGEWGELDYTGCTVESGSPPFLLLWVAAEASSRELIESIDPEKFGSNISITVRIDCTQSRHIAIPSFTVFTVFWTA